MDISLIMTVTCMPICIDIAKTHMEGSVSQIFIQALVFILWNEEDWSLKKIPKKPKSYLFSVIK